MPISPSSPRACRPAPASPASGRWTPRGSPPSSCGGGPTPPRRELEPPLRVRTSAIGRLIGAGSRSPLDFGSLVVPRPLLSLRVQLGERTALLQCLGRPAQRRGQPPCGV